MRSGFSFAEGGVTRNLAHVICSSRVKGSWGSKHLQLIDDSRRTVINTFHVAKIVVHPRLGLVCEWVQFSIGTEC